MRFLVIALLLCAPLKAPFIVVGWVEQPPYQQAGPQGPIGLDIELVQHLVAKAGYQAEFVCLGNLPAASRGAAEREKASILLGIPWYLDPPHGTRFSHPYRASQERWFYIRKTEVDPVIGAFYKPRDLPSANVRLHKTLSEMVHATQAGLIDGFIADALETDLFLGQQGLNHVFQSESWGDPQPLCLAFSNNVSEHTIATINQFIAKAQTDPHYRAIQQKYHPTFLLSQIVAQPWFFFIDILGTIAFAISGVIIAYRERMTFFGTFVMALLPAVGGGTMRDLIVGRRPIFLIANPTYLYAVLATVIVGLLWVRFFAHQKRIPNKYFMHALEFFDALGLACFAVIGVWVAFMKNIQPLALWGPLLAVLTATGGSVLRDVFRSDRHYAALQGSFYPEIALLWGCALTWFMLWQSFQLNLDQLFWAVILTMAGAFILRLCVYQQGWHNRLIRRD